MGFFWAKWNTSGGGIFSSIANRDAFEPTPWGGLSEWLLWERTLSSKWFHPSLRKLRGKVQTKQIILLKISVATNWQQFISSFATVSSQKLVLPAGGQRRRKDVSQFWWLWAVDCEQMSICFGSKPSVWASYSVLFVLIPDACMATKESPSQGDSMVGRIMVLALLLHRETLRWQ